MCCVYDWCYLSPGRPHASSDRGRANPCPPTYTHSIHTYPQVRAGGSHNTHECTPKRQREGGALSTPCCTMLRIAMPRRAQYRARARAPLHPELQRARLPSPTATLVACATTPILVDHIYTCTRVFLFNVAPKLIDPTDPRSSSRSFRRSPHSHITTQTSRADTAAGGPGGTHRERTALANRDA